MLKLIGLSGKARCGKDFIATNVFKPLGYLQWAFAWPLKVGVVGKGLASYEEVFGSIKSPTVRETLQVEGTEKGRNLYGENLWVNQTKAWLTLLEENWGINRLIITDVRFPNEVEGIKALGGKVYRIVAPSRVEKTTLTPEQQLHPSETALDNYTDFDGYINNDYGRDIEEVRAEILRLLNE